MEDNDDGTESYDEIKIQNLKRAITVSKSELLQLAYNDQKFIEKLKWLNLNGHNHILQQEYYQAIVYLNEGENILQYAASCGKTIDRTLIIATLHNQACVYQKIWELARSADYIEAVIFNIQSFLSTEKELEFTQEILNVNSQQNSKFCNYLGNKLQLIAYHLQFCAVSSQTKNHSNALNSACKALNLMKSYCEQLYTYEKFIGQTFSNQFERGLLMDLQNIRNFNQQETLDEVQKNIQKLMYKAKKSIVVFQKKMKFATVNLMKNQLTELENFSLGQLMQVNAVLVEKMQQKIEIKSELSFIKKIYKAIYISIAHFTIATEMRMLASERHGTDVKIRNSSQQFKESEVHHLVAIITAALYVPCYTKYFEHILNSFKNHYQIDLTQTSELSQSIDVESNRLDDDLIHLETQSISQRDSNASSNHRDQNNHQNSQHYSGENRSSKLKNSILAGSDYSRETNSNILIGSPRMIPHDISTNHTEKNNNSFQNKSFKTHQETISCASSNQNQKLKFSKNHKNIKNGQKSEKNFRKSNKNRLTLITSKEKTNSKKKNCKSPKVQIHKEENTNKMILIQKITSKDKHSKSKNKEKNLRKSKSKNKKSKSKNYSDEEEQHEKIIHTYNYVQFQNYNSKTIKKKAEKQEDETHFTTKNSNHLSRSKKPLINIIPHLKKAAVMTQSNKDFLKGSDVISVKFIKQNKSPDLNLNSSRSERKFLKKG